MDIEKTTFEEVEHANKHYSRTDSTGTKVYDTFTQKEMEVNAILDTMQIQNFMKALEHKIDSISFDKKTDKDDYMFKVGLKMGLESALNLWFHSDKYIDDNNK